MDKITPLFTATATCIGGRNGHTESSDHVVSADLSVPKAMGGPGKPGTATPEHLFAAGYAACFGGALDFVGRQHKQDAAKAKVTCAVSIGPREGGGFGITVKLRVEDNSLKQVDLAALAHEAHEKICPYSHATRGKCRRAARDRGRLNARPGTRAHELVVPGVAPVIRRGRFLRLLLPSALLRSASSPQWVNRVGLQL